MAGKSKARESKSLTLPTYRYNLRSRRGCFPQFLQLPKELQIMIWEYASCQSPRVLEFCNYPFSATPTQPKTVIRVPAILHTSHLARIVGLRFYSLQRLCIERFYYNCEIDVFSLVKTNTLFMLYMWLHHPHDVLGGISTVAFEIPRSRASFSMLYDLAELTLAWGIRTVYMVIGSCIASEYHERRPILNFRPYSEDYAWATSSKHKIERKWKKMLDGQYELFFTDPRSGEPMSTFGVIRALEIKFMVAEY